MTIPIHKIIYAPVGARIVYDFVITFTSILSVTFLFLAFSQNTFRLFDVIFFPISFVLWNFILGIYGKNKMASVHTKSLLLTQSGIISYLSLILINANLFPLTMLTIFTIPLSIMPRAFLNFHISHRDNRNLNYIVLDTSPVLVTGGGGYIGTQVVEKLLKENKRVRVFDKFLYSKGVFSDFFQNKNLELIEGDISDLYALTLALRNTQAVIHLAGIVGDPASSLDEKFTRHVNIISTRMLKEMVKAFRIPKFIFASSCSVYGSSEKIVHENSPLNPQSLYAKTKIDAEQELLHDTFDEFHPTILRFATVFGHSKKPRFDLVANLFVALAMNNQVITVTNGKTWRPFVHVDDVANSIITVLKTPQEKVSRQIFNVGDDSLNYKIEDLAKLVKNIVRHEKRVSIVLKKTHQDPRNYKVSFKKIKNDLRFQTETTMEEGLLEIVNHFKKGTYGRNYTDPYYSNLETTKEVIKEFNSKDYQQTHFSTLS